MLADKFLLDMVNAQLWELAENPQLLALPEPEYTPSADVRRLERELTFSLNRGESGDDSITAVLAGKEQGSSLPAIESQIHSLQERQMELYQLAVAAGPDCLDYDEELQQVNIAKTQLIAKKAELEREECSTAEFDRNMEQIGTVIDRSNANVTVFDDVTIRQLISCIKVLDKTRILVRFKDGTEIKQEVKRE